jgi:hypothetical protein
MNRTLNALVVCFLFAAPAMAGLITDGSFEAASPGPLPDGSGDSLAPGSTKIAGWTIIGSGPDVAWLPTGYAGIAAQDGSYFLDLTGYGYVVDGVVGVQQTTTLGAGNYTLTFYIGSIDNDEPESIYASAGDQSNVVFTDSDTGAGYHWKLATLNFNVATSGPVTISLLGDAADSKAVSPYLGLDNVDVEPATSSTPEPATALPVFLALGGWLLCRRKIRAA